MYSVSVSVSSEEWMRIQQAAAKQWLMETLSRSEILRRYVLVGIASLRNISADEAARLAREFQDSIYVRDQRLRQ